MFKMDAWGRMYETDVQSQLESPPSLCRTLHGGGPSSSRGLLPPQAGAGRAGRGPGGGLCNLPKAAWYLGKDGESGPRSAGAWPASRSVTVSAHVQLFNPNMGRVG